MVSFHVAVNGSSVKGKSHSKAAVCSTEEQEAAAQGAWPKAEVTQLRKKCAAIRSLPGLEVTLSDVWDRLSSPSLGGRQVYTKAYVGTTDHLNML